MRRRVRQALHSRPEWQWSERVVTQSPQEGDREMFLEYCDVFRTIFPDLAHLMLRFYQGGFEDFQASLAALKFDVTALLEDPMKRTAGRVGIGCGVGLVIGRFDGGGT